MKETVARNVESTHGYMIAVLRLGHRLPRDCRITTHVALTARALGATEFYYAGQRDKSFVAAVEKVVEEFGGPFTITFSENPEALVKKKREEGYCILHLTMYGMPYEHVIQKIKGTILIIVGSEKVPPEFYQLADYNLAVTSQPISEVSALGICLHALGKQPFFAQAKKKVIPTERGKTLQEVTP